MCRREDVPGVSGSGPRPWLIYLCWAWLILGGVLFARQLIMGARPGGL